MHFKARAHEKLGDARLQGNLSKIKGKFVNKRRSAIVELDDFEATRDAASAIRQRALDDLDVWLETFEANARARGATVLWAATPDDVNKLVLEIAFRHGAKRIVKSKSMVSEESALDLAIEGAGLEVVETDLGEYILQINGYEPPSHLVGPALHKSKEEVSELFHRKHGTPRKDGIEELCREARAVLREKYLTADIGISGGNFFVAETGSVVLVTNEGNATLCTTLPEGARRDLRHREGRADARGRRDADAPAAALGDRPVDLELRRRADRHQGRGRAPRRRAHVLHPRRRGRTGVLASDVAEALRCIRCGACMNHCPVYQAIGGHAYGWVYPGPIGSILTPMYAGLENSHELPQASTMCNQCGVVCPVKIPLPDLQRKLAERAFAEELRPWQERAALRTWAWVARRPRLYAALSRVGMRLLRLGADRHRMIRRLPFGRGWTAGRDMPAPAGRTFRELYAARRARGDRR
jgi:L-lactate dehydrogenase complex protein LldF